MAWEGIPAIVNVIIQSVGLVRFKSEVNICGFGLFIGSSTVIRPLMSILCNMSGFEIVTS